nr:MAG TPA: hypothetical protein [Caudoviricetes sp.]
MQGGLLSNIIIPSCNDYPKVPRLINRTIGVRRIVSVGEIPLNGSAAPLIVRVKI